MFVEIFMEQVNYADICEYVRFWLESDSEGETLSRETEIVEDILTRSEGVFLWVVIVVQNKRAAKDRGKGKGYLLKLLKDTPTVLQHLYEHSMRDIHEDDRTELAKLTQWLLFSRKPLCLEDLRYALAFHQTSPPRSVREWELSDDYRSLTDFEKAICDISRGLIEVKPSAVQFIHETVRTFCHQRVPEST